MALSIWPNFPAAATLTKDRLGHGWGNDRVESRRRATGELIEIASCCRWGDEETVVATLNAMQKTAWSPDQLGGFSKTQRTARAEWNVCLEGIDWIPPSLALDRPIEWMSAWELTQNSEIFVPAECVLIGAREVGDLKAYAVADTNGCAAGSDREGALLSAIFELVERDAVARWWYGRGGGKRLKPEEFKLGLDVQRSLVRRNRHLWLLNITSDIAIPTMAAIAADRDGRHVSVGFATRCDPALAARAAIGEMMQMELKTAMAAKNPVAVPELERWFQEFEYKENNHLSRDYSTPPQPMELKTAEELEACVTLLSQANCRIAVIEFTRPCFEIPVCRVVSPDLCHWKPRFSNQRLVGFWQDRAEGHPAMNTVFLRV